MHKFVLKFSDLSLIFFVSLLLILGQSLVHTTILDSREVSHGTATFKSWTLNGGDIDMLVTCDNGKEVLVEEDELILNYLKNPRPLTYSVSAAGRIHVKLSKEHL